MEWGNLNGGFGGIARAWVNEHALRASIAVTLHVWVVVAKN
jgi:hypothetical protein